MRYRYICNCCAEKLTGKPTKSLSVAEYGEVVGNLAVEVDHGLHETPQVLCSTCGAVMQKLLGLYSAFVRGYGFKDKKGAKNDMNLYQMTSGNDPYAQHRKSSDKVDLVTKLRQQKDHIPKSKKVFLKK